jgi:hypothetical protein
MLIDRRRNFSKRRQIYVNRRRIYIDRCRIFINRCRIYNIVMLNQYFSMLNISSFHALLYRMNSILATEHNFTRQLNKNRPLHNNLLALFIQR